MNKNLDVICLGRAAVDLYGLQLGGRLEDMESFAKYLGGSSANLAAGLARLGTKSAMLTRVGNEHMGRFVREALQREGVDVSHVVTDPNRLTALVILGISDRDSFPHIFYRENCADMAIETSDFDEAFIASSRALAITGTHLSTDHIFSVAQKAVEFARRNGTKVVLDIDYRPVLWGLVPPGGGESRFVASAEVSSRIQSLLPDCDLLVGTEEEIRIAGGADDVLEALYAVRKHTAATIVLKRGPLGCSVFEGAIPGRVEDGISVQGVGVEVLNVLGAGDAFLSGFMNAWLNGADWESCARQGNACGALVVSRHGCTPAMPTQPELADYLERAASIARPDQDERINYLHQSTTRQAPPEQLCILAFDHRRQLEDLLVTTEPMQQRIAAFKDLVCQAALRVAQNESGGEQLGVIVDERYGEAVLARLTAKQWWIGRPVEVPGSRPLELDPRNNIGLPLQSWPASHVVKCLVFYHPTDKLELRLQQERRIHQLHADCVTLDRELLLEVIVTSQGQDCDEYTVANVMRRFYNLGVMPAWWKLESQCTAGWERISSVIERYDPHCNGVLLLGLDAPAEQLKESFKLAVNYDVCKGFAVGRSIFGDAARQWFDGKMDDADVVSQVATNYQNMIELWREAVSSSEAIGTPRAMA